MNSKWILEKNSDCQWIYRKKSEFKVNSREKDWIQSEFLRKIVNSKWIHEKDSIVNILFVKRNQFDKMALAIWQFSERRDLLIHYLFRDLFFIHRVNFTLSLSQILFEFPFYFANSLFFFRKFTINSLFVSRTDFKRTIYFAYNIFHDLFHVLTLSLISFCEFTNDAVFFREFTLNSL